MTNTRLDIVDMRSEDIDAVAALAQAAWFSRYDALQSTIARYFVMNHFLRATWLRVARLDGEVVGVMLASTNNADAPYHEYAAAEKGRLEQVLNNSEVGRTFLPFFARYVRDHETLEAPARRECDGECQMYIVAPDKQGTGIGSLLWDDMIAHFHAQGVRRYFLYTDTDCNWRIYGVKGLTIVNGKEDVKGDGSTYGQYIYVGELSR